MKEQLVEQLKTQISDLERFIQYLHGEGTCICKCPKSLKTKTGTPTTPNKRQPSFNEEDCAHEHDEEEVYDNFIDFNSFKTRMLWVIYYLYKNECKTIFAVENKNNTIDEESSYPDPDVCCGTIWLLYKSIPHEFSEEMSKRQPLGVNIHLKKVLSVSQENAIL